RYEPALVRTGARQGNTRKRGARRDWPSRTRGGLELRFFRPPRVPTGSPSHSFQLDESRAERAAGAQTLKLLPQPQPDWALGLVTRKAAPPSSSTKSTAEPLTSSRLTESTTSLTPSVSATVS